MEDSIRPPPPPPSSAVQQKSNSAIDFLSPLPNAATLQKPKTTGSATGNPRNKCALKPGHSLMDWIRLGNSGVDLSGTKGRAIPVSAEELAKHNQRADAWLAIRGKVYNVTRYMDFHPGGIDELMRGVGRDATKLFDEIHAWVNYEQLLAKCYVGPLRRNIVQMDADIIKAFDSIKTNKSKTASLLTSPSLPPPPPPPVEVVPRLDWIQTRAAITFYIYTRQLCNPAFVLQHKNDRLLHARLQIDCTVHQLELELHDDVIWPPNKFQINPETGKIELQLMKTTANNLWQTYGRHKLTKPQSNFLHEEYDYEILQRHNINHNSYELCLRNVQQQSTQMLVPIGWHVCIETCINGEVVRRSYTPISEKFLHKEDDLSKTSMIQNTNADILNFLIKTYADGLLSQQLHDQLPIGHCLRISEPRGNFKLQQLRDHQRIALLAAGSGLTPFLRIIEHLLQRNGKRIEYLLLMYFNKTESDIWCRDELQQLHATDERFHFRNILSEANDEWSGDRGRLSKVLLTPLADSNSTEYVTYVAACGPSGFNQQVEMLLQQELKYKACDMHIFQG